MENKKSSKTILIVLLVVLIAICSVMAINFFSFRKRFKSFTTGHFEIKDGVETYVMAGQVIINSLVEVDGKLYYVDDKGHKVKDTWAIIDNDGNYGYFGSLGDLVKDRIREIGGKKYYFDKDGILYVDKTSKEIKKIDGVEYIANANGELRLATEKEPVVETVAPAKTQQTVAATSAAQTQVPQVAQTTAAVISTAPPFANAINVVAPTTTVAAMVEGPGAGIVAPVSDTTEAQSGEVKITKTEKVIDTVDGEDYECTITLLKPILSGSNSEETMSINASIDEVMDAWMEDVTKVVEDYVTLPKSVTFTSATLGTVKKTSIIVHITGNIKPKSGSSKTIKYRITYDRENETAEIVRSSNN